MKFCSALMVCMIILKNTMGVIMGRVMVKKFLTAVLITYSAVKRFGGNPILGIVLGCIMIHPRTCGIYGDAMV